MEADPGDATPLLPQRRSLKALREAAADCRGCHLWQPATQTVFGEGPRRARLMLVGEVPGDREDRGGRPFVWPSGRELDNALQHAGIDRASAYVTNVVKHFKFEERGKRRIHQRPDAGAIKSGRPWFDAERRSTATSHPSCWPRSTRVELALANHAVILVPGAGRLDNGRAVVDTLIKDRGEGAGGRMSTRAPQQKRSLHGAASPRLDVDYQKELRRGPTRGVRVSPKDRARLGRLQVKSRSPSDH